MSKLNIFSNDPEQDPIVQLNQINLALKSINTWGQRVKNQLCVDLTDNSTSNVTVNNTNYQNIGISSAFTCPSSLIQISGKILISATAESQLGIFLDDIEIETITIPITNKGSVFFSLITSATTGVSHLLVLKMKGNAIKYFADKNKVQVLSLTN